MVDVVSVDASVADGVVQELVDALKIGWVGLGPADDVLDEEVFLVSTRFDIFYCVPGRGLSD